MRQQQQQQQQQQQHQQHLQGPGLTALVLMATSRFVMPRKVNIALDGRCKGVKTDNYNRNLVVNVGRRLRDNTAVAGVKPGRGRRQVRGDGRKQRGLWDEV